jgi:hypothetical protein
MTNWKEQWSKTYDEWNSSPSAVGTAKTLAEAFISTEIIEKLIEDASSITDNDMGVEQKLRNKWL